MGGAGAEARGRLSPFPTTLLLHVPMVFLQAANFESSEVVLVHEAFHGRGEGGDGRRDRNARHDRLGTHLDLIDHGFGTGFGGVHDPLHFLIVDKVEQVRAATGDAEHGAGLDALVVEHRRGAAGGVNLVAHVHEALDERHSLLLVFVLERDEDVALARDLVAGSQLALEVGKAAVAIEAHDFAGGFHFRRKRDVDTRELDEREYGFLDAHVRHVDFFGEADLFESFAQHAAASVACQRDADGLGHERHGTGGARVHFDHVEFAILHGELHIHEAANVEFLREFLGVGADLVLDFLGECHRRDDACGVTGVDACGFHVFHDGAHHGVLAVADAVHVEFGCVFEEAVDKNRLAFANGGGFFHELAEVLFLIDNHHAAAAENEARAHENGVADFLDDGEGFFHVVGDAAFGLLDADLVNQLLEEVAVFGEVDVFGACTDHVRTGLLETHGEVQRSLTAELHDDARTFFAFVNAHHVFERKGFKVEFVRSIVVGGNRFRVGVHHNDFVAFATQRKGGVAAAVVEFDTLTDSVRAATEHHDSLLVSVTRDFADGLGIFGIATVVIRRDGFEFTGAGIHGVVARDKADLLAHRHDFFGSLVEQVTNLDIAVAEFLGLAEERHVFCQRLQRPCGKDFVFVEG